MTADGSVPKRSDIEEKYKWDLTELYENAEEWEREFKECEAMLPDISGFRGTLTESNENIAQCIRFEDRLSRKLEKVFTWAHLKHDEDLSNTTFQSLHDRAFNLAVRMETESSYIVPEILTLDRDGLADLMKDPKLEFARETIRSMIRQKDHYLSEKEEKLLSLADEALDASSKTFKMLNDADLSFPTIKDEEGNDIELSHGRFVGLLLSRDRDLRKRALENYYASYHSHRNTFASTLEGELKRRSFKAKARNYPSSLHASLDNDEVDPSLYNGLIEAVHHSFPDLHSYVKLRKEALGVDELHMYDVYTPLVKDFERKVRWEDAKELVLEAIEPLGEEYRNIVREGLSSGWVDVYESRKKRSGAYSSGCYDSPPYILMNYDGNIKELFTLAHEMGHSIHSYLSNKNQPHITADYRIFVAEVASTVNEVLLLDHLRRKWRSKEEQAYLVNHYLESFKGTVFRQTMFAEFERDITAMVEKNIPITADSLGAHYGKMNREYFGEDMIIDREIELEWARIPHFYYNFYVYKYATSFSVANAIALRILRGDTDQLDRYLDLLKAGSSRPPMDLLKDAGMDLSTPTPIKEALKVFSGLVDEMGALL
ncbi:MAG: oligoendopeptidase F [Thermoplasmatota archaeon]